MKTYRKHCQTQGHYSMKKKSLYALWVMICFCFTAANAIAMVATNQVLSTPTLLPPSDSLVALSLKEAFDKALTHHTALRLAKNQLAQKRAEKWIYFGALMPKLRVSSTFTRNIPEAKASMFDAAAQANLNRKVAGLLRNAGDSVGADALDYQADLMGRRDAQKTIVFNPKYVADGKLTLEVPLFNGAALAKAFWGHDNVRLYDAKLNEERAKTIYATAQTYFLALHKRNMVEVRKKALAFAEEVYQKAQSRKTRGLMMNKDFKASFANFKQRQAELLGATLEYRSAISSLGHLVGMNQEFLINDPDAMAFDALNTDAERLITIALINRPDIKASNHALYMAQEERLGHYLQFLPNVVLKGDVNYTSNDKSMVGEHFTGAVSLSASINLFDGGISWASLKQAALRKQEAEIRLGQLKMDVNATIRGRKEKLLYLRNLEQAHNAKKDAAKEASLVALSRYDSGLIESDEFLEIHEKNLEAEIAHKKVQNEIIEENLALMYETGLLTAEWAL